VSLTDYILKGSEWDQADSIKLLTANVKSGYCRALAIYWLSDCVTNAKVTVAANFSALIKDHPGNLEAIAQTQADTARIGELNGLEMATIHLLQVSKGLISINVGGGQVWIKANPVHGKGATVSLAVHTSVTTPKAAIVHLEWDGGWFSSGGAHALGIIREDSGGSTLTYSVFDPNHGILRAYTDTLDDLMTEIVSSYGVDRFMVMPLQ
jgi:hypothetical protein